MKRFQRQDYTALEAAVEQDNIVKAQEELDVILRDVMTQQLFTALSSNSLRVLEHFLEKGANVNVDNEMGGETLLTLAVKLDSEEATGIILSNGADPNLVAKHFGFSALRTAVKDNKLNIARLLLEHGADPDESDAMKGSILYSVVCAENKGMVELLLEYGVDVNLSGTFGRNNPLKTAIEKDNCTIARLLLQNGASLDFGGSSMKTPVKLAKSQEMIDLLKEYIPLSNHLEDSEPDLNICTQSAQKQKVGTSDEDIDAVLARGDDWVLSAEESMRKMQEEFDQSCAAMFTFSDRGGIFAGGKISIKADIIGDSGLIEGFEVDIASVSQPIKASLVGETSTVNQDADQNDIEDSL